MRKTKLMLETEKQVGMDLGDYLRREYKYKKRCAPEIARELDVSNTALYKWLNKYRIHHRKMSEAKLNGRKKPTKALLYDLHIKQGKKTEEIGEELGFSKSAICNYLKEYEIKKLTWKDLEYTLNFAQEVMQKHGFKTLPGCHKLCELSYSSLSVAITKYHGGFHKFRKLLGEEPKKRKDGTWKDLEFAIQQAEELMQKYNFKTLPRADILSKLGYSALSKAIVNYHRGYVVFRELLSKKLGIKTQKQELTELLKGYARQ